jgi:hypothetical protein
LQILSKKIAAPLGLFILFLLYFVFGTGWYAPAQLVVRGKVLQEKGSLDIRWDSGSGYNGYERRRFVLATTLSPGEEKHHMLIRRVGEKNPASLAADISINKIAVDGHDLDLAEISRQHGLSWDGSKLKLLEDTASLALEVDAKESIIVDTPTNNSSGLVEIGVNGKLRQRDLYAANTDSTQVSFSHWIVDAAGDFVVRMPLPRYRVEQILIRNGDQRTPLSVQSIDIVTSGKSLSVYTGTPEIFNEAIVPGRSEVQKQYLNTLQNAFQILFAALSTWVALALLRLYRRCSSSGGVFSRQRRVFWLFFIGAAATYSFWLIPFWPGVTSVDSLKIWRAAVLPDVFLNDHPLLNIVLYKYLAHIWNDMAVVPVFHVVMMSVLVSWIFYSLYRQRLSLGLILPFYLFAVVSVPVGLYNTVLWKDIPFAMLIVLWAYTLADLYRRKRDGCYHLSKEAILALFCLLLALGLIRHNGLIYLLVIPFLFVVLGLVNLRRTAFVGGIAVALVAMVLLMLKLVGRIQDFNYVVVQGLSFVGNLLDGDLSTLLQRSYKNYWGMLDINQTASKWDLWHFYLKDRFAYTFLLHSQWYDVFPYLRQRDEMVPKLLREAAMAVYWRSYDRPWVYLSWNPLPILVILPLTILFCRKLPLSAIFSFVVLIQALALICIDVMNWRYYYFLCLAGYFLVPLILLDIRRWKSGDVHSTSDQPCCFR